MSYHAPLCGGAREISHSKDGALRPSWRAKHFRNKLNAISNFHRRSVAQHSHPKVDRAYDIDDDRRNTREKPGRQTSRGSTKGS